LVNDRLRHSFLLVFWLKFRSMQIPLIGKKLNPWLLGFILVGIVGTGSIAYQVTTRNSEKPNIANLTVSVKAETLKVTIKASGSAVPFQTVNVSPKVSGRLQELYVEQGDKVTKGQILARMDDSNIRPQIMQAKASLASAQANLSRLRNGSRREDIAAAIARVESAAAKAALANEKVSRNKELEAQGAITRDRLDELISDRTATAANLREQQRLLEQLNNGSRPEDIAQAEAQVQEAIARLKIVEVQQEDTIVRAPFAGKITQKFTNVGSFVTPTTSASATSSATSTSIVAVGNGLEILAKVPEVDIGQIRVGQAVEIVADAYSDKVFKGRVRLIAPEAIVEQNVTSFQVRVALETGKNELQSGMNTDLKLVGQSINNALVVPTVAIVTENNQTGLLLPDENNKPQFRPVTLGITVNNRTQILKGVNSGDRVFLNLPASKQPGNNQ
jgi:HlyD family secretion protein